MIKDNDLNTLKRWYLIHGQQPFKPYVYHIGEIYSCDVDKYIALRYLNGCRGNFIVSFTDKFINEYMIC